MSQPIPPPPAVTEAWMGTPSASPEPAKPGKLPQGVVVVAVLGILFGILGLMWNTLTAAISLSGVTLGAGERQLEVPADTFSAIWALGDLTLALLLVAASISLFFRRHWALRLSIIVAALQIASTLGSTTAQILLLGPAWKMADSAAHAGIMLGLGLRLLGIVFPAFAIIVLMQRSSRDAMR